MCENDLLPVCYYYFFDSDDNKALTHSLVTSVPVYFLLPITASLSPTISLSMESIFSIPQCNSQYLSQSSSKAVLKFIGDIDETCCLFCWPSCNSNSVSI